MPSSRFDQKLIKKIGLNSLPKWPQFKYLGSFLSKKEKIIINISLAILFLTTISWGITWFIRNNAIVPASGGDYSEALVGQPKYINPLFTSANDIDADLASLMYSGLFQFNNDQKLLPDLASDYTISGDGRIYDINLRKDVKWSDGEPFTVDDVIYTFSAIQDTEVGSPLLVAFQSISVERVGDYSARFTLKEPFAPFLSSLTVGILPQHIWSNIPPSAIRLAKTNIQPIGSGPWKFNKLTKDSGGNIQNYALVRNEYYYRDFPHLKTLTFKFYIDYTQAANAIKSQDVMAASFLPNELTNKIVGKNFLSYKFELPQYTALFFNQDFDANLPAGRQVLKDSDIRLALNLAINKDTILTQALANEGEIINSPFLKGKLGYNSAINFPGFDAEKANQLLDKTWKRIQPEDFFQTEYDMALKARQSELDELKKNALTSTDAVSSAPEELLAEKQKLEKEASDLIRQGMDTDQSFYRKNKANDVLTITITTADTPEYQQVAQTIAKMWRAIGVKTKIQLVNSSQISKDILRDRNYQILLYGEIVGSDPDPYPFWHSSQISYPGLNLSMFIDRSADKLLEDARATTTEQTRANQYEKFQQILAKEIPAVFLYTPVYNFLAAKEIKGITFKQIFYPADRFNNLGGWYIKTKRQWIR